MIVKPASQHRRLVINATSLLAAQHHVTHITALICTLLAAHLLLAVYCLCVVYVYTRIGHAALIA